MADIQRYPFVRHLRGAPTVHVRHQRGGRVVREGTGQSFWFRPLSAVISEITEAYIVGTPLVALCGYTWVPSQSPKGLPVCEMCKELAAIAFGQDAEKIGF